MGTITTNAAATYRDYNTDGLPASGQHDPVKADIRRDAVAIDSALTQLAAAFVADGATVIYPLRSTLYADLAHSDGSFGIVWNDGVNNGVFVKYGASGTGSWGATGLMLAGAKGDDGASFYEVALATGYVPAGTTEAQFVGVIAGMIVAQATAAALAARDQAQNWAEGTGAPGGTGTKSSKSWAADSAASAGTASDAKSVTIATKTALDAAIAGHPFAIAIGAGDVTFETIGVAKLAAIPGSAHVVDTRGYFTPGDGGGARYVRVATDPAIGAGGFRSADRLMPDGSLDMANGGWWRIVNQGNVAYLEQFAGDGTTLWDGSASPPSYFGSDNLQPYYDALASFSRPFDANRVSGPIIRGKAGGCYQFSDTLNLHKQHLAFGSATGMDDAIAGTIFLFPGNATHKHGVVFNESNTDYDTSSSVGLGSAQGTYWDGISVCSYGATSEDRHAIRVRTKVSIRNCNIRNFGGDGINGRAYASTSDPYTIGNINYSSFRNMEIRCGGYASNLEGADANGCTIDMVDGRQCGLGGFRDRSYFGNSYGTILVDDCGKGAKAGIVRHNGRVWLLVGEQGASGGDFSLGGSVEPGTDDTVWYPYDSWPGFPLGGGDWVAGNTYKVALAFYTLGVSPVHYIYTESLPVYAPNSPTIASASARLIGATYPKLLAGRPIKSTEPDYAPSGSFQTRVGTDFDNGEYLGFFNSSFTAYSLRYMSFRQMRLGNGLDIGLHSGAYSDSDSSNWAVSWAKFYSAGSLYTMNQPGGVAYGVAFPRFGLADPSSENNTRRLQTGTSVPTSGLFGRGHRILNASPAAGAVDNWVCTTSGGIGGGAWVAASVYYLTSTAINGGVRYVSSLAPARVVSMAYAVGDMFSNRGRNYKVTLAGTTSADTIGKGGLGTVTDGTLQATFVGQVPTNAVLPRSGTTGPVSGSTTVPERDGDVWWLAVPDAVFVANYQPTKTTVTVDLPSIAAGANSAMQTTTVSGAGVGDIVHVTCSTYLGDFVTMRGFVSSTNNVKWFVTNGTASAVDPPSATYNIVVQRYG